MNMTRPSKESVQVQEIVELPVDGYIVGILGSGDYQIFVG